MKRFLAALVGYLAIDENELLVDFLGRGSLKLLVLTSRPAEWIKFRRIRQLSDIFSLFIFLQRNCIALHKNTSNICFWETFFLPRN